MRRVGVDTVTGEVGISKRTLYNHFPSKDALIVAYLSRRFWPAGSSDRPPAGQILHRFDLLERIFTDEGFHGCKFVNAVVG